MNISNEIYEGLLGLLISAGVTIVGFTIFFKRQRVLKKGVHAVGSLMEWETSAGKSSHSYYPVVGFNTADNKWIVKQYEIARSYKNLKIGDDITLIYNSLNPEEFILDDLSSKTAAPLFFVIGLAGVIASVIYLILKY